MHQILMLGNSGYP